MQIYFFLKEFILKWIVIVKLSRLNHGEATCNWCHCLIKSYSVGV